MTRRTIRKTLAEVAIPMAFLLVLSACGQDSVTCNLDCEDVSIPDSLVSEEYRDTSCEVCAKQFYAVRALICGREKNPNCRCFYFCQTMVEFKF
jgi:hypothetical protein